MVTIMTGVSVTVPDCISQQMLFCFIKAVCWFGTTSNILRQKLYLLGLEGLVLLFVGMRGWKGECKRAAVAWSKREEKKKHEWLMPDC